MQAIKKKYTWALKLFITAYIAAKFLIIMHWPEARLLSLFSAIILIIFYPLRYSAKPSKVILDHVKMAWVITYCTEIFFYLEDFMPLVILQTILFFYWFVNEGFFYFDFNLNFKKNKEREKGILDDFEEKPIENNHSAIIDGLLIFCGVLVVFSALFKLMHWPFASELMIIGYGSFAVVIWFKTF